MTANISGSTQTQAVPHEFATEVPSCQSREEKVSPIAKQAISSTSLPNSSTSPPQDMAMFPWGGVEATLQKVSEEPEATMSVAQKRRFEFYSDDSDESYDSDDPNDPAYDRLPMYTYGGARRVYHNEVVSDDSNDPVLYHNEVLPHQSREEKVSPIAKQTISSTSLPNSSTPLPQDGNVSPGGVEAKLPAKTREQKVLEETEATMPVAKKSRFEFDSDDSIDYDSDNSDDSIYHCPPPYAYSGYELISDDSDNPDDPKLQKFLEETETTMSATQKCTLWLACCQPEETEETETITSAPRKRRFEFDSDDSIDFKDVPKPLDQSDVEDLLKLLSQ